MNSSFSGNGNSNSNYSSQRSTTTSSSLKNYNFDFGIGSSTRSSSNRPLKDQKNPSPSPASSTTSWNAAPNKTSWTHQPAPAASASRSGLSNPSSMVGDIFGKSWTSAAPASGVGLPKADPNLFGDLLGSALGQGKSDGNLPLKDAAPRKTAFSTESLFDSLPKTTGTAASVAAAAGSAPMRPAGYGSAGNSMGGAKIATPLGGPSMKSSASVASSAPSSDSKKDPFGSLMDFHSKPSATLNSNSKVSSSTGGGGGIGGFDDSFGVFEGANVSEPKDDSFGIPSFPGSSVQKEQTTLQGNGGTDPLDMLFSSSAPAADNNGAGYQMFEEASDWDVAAGFDGSDGGVGATELEGLPPPPAGVTPSVAKSKGMDNHKQGQFADAIKWLSWALVLLEKSGDKSAITEVLTCRATCYKEVGEYKKAVADCSTVLEHDGNNVSVLVQRALLYESTEKYKLGAEDLRTVLKIDPTNRIARTTIHRLTQLVG